MENQDSHPIHKYGKDAPGGVGGGSYMKGKEIHPGAKKRQDGKNHKGGANSKDGLWDSQDSEQKGENFPGA